ncbi:MAG: MBL fold metallo-hydrolase [Candidatus Bathyarchaeota archaeon]|nr:MBL fold metallo-hydrolase [Candidatus Bathyarchaeota archaeon]MDH5494480.1 MBL fold metallo-hydrolase [Candidatus Bathyarchaeota archaeon]
MNLKMLTVGSLFTNCYVAWCSKTREAIVIDPGFNRQSEAGKVLDVLKENVLEVKFIVDTHGHPDHTCGNGIVKSVTGAPILIHKLDADMLGKGGKELTALFGFHVSSPAADGFLDDGDVVRFGEVVLRVLHTPGHSFGSISLVGEDCVFTGDTLFAGSIGRVDLPGGSGKEIMRSLREKLAVLPDRLVVYPGHGFESTIGEEKRSNPFLQKGFDVSLLG